MTTPFILQCSVRLFEDAVSAGAAIDPILADYVAELEMALDTSALRPASTGGVDAKRADASAGRLPVDDLESPYEEFSIGLLITRRAETVRFLVAATLASDPLEPLLALHEAIKTRLPSNNPVAIDGDGYHTGGIWATLPTLADIPAGMTFAEDVDETMLAE